MSDKLEEFKKIFTSMMIKQIIKSGTPPAKKWPIPTVFRMNDNIMRALLSTKGYDLYLELGEQDQGKALQFVENCGPYLCDIIGCPTYEEWKEADGDPIFVDDEQEQEIQEKYNLDLN